VDRLTADVGSTVELTDVLLIAGNGDVRIGRPTVEGARVLADVLAHGRGKKIVVFKYKAKTRYRRRQGHRQDFTRLAIRQILPEAGTAVKAEAKPKRSRRAPKAAATAAEAAPIEEPAVTPKRPRAARAKASPASKPRPKSKRTESKQ